MQRWRTVCRCFPPSRSRPTSPTMIPVTHPALSCSSRPNRPSTQRTSTLHDAGQCTRRDDRFRFVDPIRGRIELRSGRTAARYRARVGSRGRNEPGSAQLFLAHLVLERGIGSQLQLTESLERASRASHDAPGAGLAKTNPKCRTGNAGAHQTRWRRQRRTQALEALKLCALEDSFVQAKSDGRTRRRGGVFFGLAKC